MKLWEKRRIAISLLMPNRCPFCNRVVGAQEFWCDKCYESLNFVDVQDPPPRGVDRLYAVCYYDNDSKSAVLRMKNGFYRYSIDAFSAMISEAFPEEIRQADVLTAIPSSRERCRELGYPHSEKIAELVSVMSGVPYQRTMKVRNFKNEQKYLGAKLRSENVRDAFVIVPSADIRGKTVLVIDDVCTTGATLSAAAEILRNAGAASVDAAVFARTPKR